MKKIIFLILAVASLCFAEIKELSISIISIKPINVCPKKIINSIDSLERYAAKIPKDSIFNEEDGNTRWSYIIQNMIPLDTVGLCFDTPMYFFRYENKSYLTFFKRRFGCVDVDYCKTLDKTVEKRKKDLTELEKDSLITIGLLYADTLVKTFSREEIYGVFSDNKDNKISLIEDETCFYESQKEDAMDSYCIKNSKGIRIFVYIGDKVEGTLIENSKGTKSKATLVYKIGLQKETWQGYFKNSNFFIGKSPSWFRLKHEQIFLNINNESENFIQDGEYCREFVDKSVCTGDEAKFLSCVNKKENKCYDKERFWVNSELVNVTQVNEDCKSHGWEKAKTCGGSWNWNCNLNGREMEGSDCRGFAKW